MTTRDMAYIVSIAEEQSITRAAAKMYMAQPALSQCVQKVEKELGVLIFLRQPNGVKLTAEGECFLEFAKKTLTEQKTMEKKLLDLQNSDRGVVQLGFTGMQAMYVLPYFLPQFKEKYPSIDIVLTEATSEDIEEKLIKGAVEVGIVHPPLLREELEYFEINHDEMVIVPRSNSRYHKMIYYRDDDPMPYLDAEFLRNEPLIVTQSWQRSRMVCEQIFDKMGFHPPIKQVSRNLSTLDALAQVDYGTVLLPSKQLSDALRRRGVYKIDPAYSVPYTFNVAVLKNAYLSSPTEKLVEFLKEIRGTF